MSGLIRARARQVTMVLVALLSVVAVAPVVAYASGLSRMSFHPVPVRAIAASVPKGTYMLGGITSQEAPVVAAVSHRATSVDVRIALNMQCTSGSFLTLDRSGPVPVGRRGAVRGLAVKIPVDLKNGILGGSDAFSGQMNASRSRLTGHWRLHVLFQNTDGSTDTCDSGPVSFTAGS